MLCTAADKKAFVVAWSLLPLARQPATTDIERPTVI